MRNRLQTRRDDLTVSWLELETYIDVNFDNPFDKTQYSNLFNKHQLHARALGFIRNLLAGARLREGIHRSEHQREHSADRQSAGQLSAIVT